LRQARRYRFAVSLVKTDGKKAQRSIPTHQRFLIAKPGIFGETLDEGRDAFCELPSLRFG
jgi:hypothetical protein